MKIFLETDRLIIEVPTMDQLELAFSLDSDSDVMHYMGGARSKEETHKWLERNIQHHKNNGFGFGFVYEKKTGKFVGRAGLLYLAYDETQPDIEVGYRLHKHYWGKGYATELAKALIEWGFENLAVNKLVGVINPQNMRSRRVLEKAGMIYIGNSLYNGIDVDRYEIIKLLHE